MCYCFYCRVLHIVFCFVFAQLKNEENKNSNALLSMNSLTFNPFTNVLWKQ